MNQVAELDLIGDQVQKRNLALGDGVGHTTERHIAKLAFDVGHRVLLAGAADLDVERPRIGDVPGINAVAADADGAEFLVANGQRIGGAPTLIDLRARGEEINIALERGLEHLVPVHEVGEDRQRLRRERVETGSEDIGHAALIDERAHLRLTNGELGAVLNFHVLHGVPPGQYAIAGLHPIDYVNELFLDETAYQVTDSHDLSSILSEDCHEV